MFNKLLQNAPYFFWALLLITSVGLLIELEPSKGGWPYWDKVQHMIIFATLTSIGWLAFIQQRLWLYFALAFYGMLIEFLQSALTVTRTGSLQDWLADVAGIVIATLLSTLISSRFLPDLEPNK